MCLVLKKVYALVFKSCFKFTLLSYSWNRFTFVLPDETEASSAEKQLARINRIVLSLGNV